MQNEEHIVRYTADELRKMREEGQFQSDYARLDAMTDEELEASIDFEEEGEFDWDNSIPGIAEPQQEITVHLDRGIIALFRKQKPEYGSRMNSVLRSFVDAQREQESEETQPSRRAG